MHGEPSFDSIVRMPFTFDDGLMLGLAGLILSLSVFFGLWISRSTHEATQKRALQGNQILREIVSQMAGYYVANKPYEHPLMGTMEMPGMVEVHREGVSGFLTLNQDVEDPNFGHLEVRVELPKERTVRPFHMKGRIPQNLSATDENFITQYIKGLDGLSLSTEIRKKIFRIAAEASTFKCQKNQLYWSSKRSFFHKADWDADTSTALAHVSNEILLLVVDLQKLGPSPSGI